MCVLYVEMKAKMFYEKLFFDFLKPICVTSTTLIFEFLHPNRQLSFIAIRH